MAERRRRVRSRPNKQTLSLDAFLDAAMALLRRDGANALTLRRIAREMQTGPASVYAYVRTVQELHTLVIDQVLADVDLHVGLAEYPRERLEAILTSYVSVLLEHDGLGQLASGVLPHGDNAIALTESVLDCMRRLGLSAGRAAWGYDLLMLQMTAVAAEQERRRIQDDPKARAQQAYERVDPVRYPNIDAVQAHLFAGGSARKTWAIDAMLNGIAAAPEPEAHDA